MDVDDAFAPSDDDTGEDRDYWVAMACPCKESCSANSWGRVLKCSYISEEFVRGCIRDHLVSSGLHNLSKEEADDQSWLAEVEMRTETYADRAAVRQQIKRAQEQSADKETSKDKPHGDKRTAEALESEIKRLRSEMSALESDEMDDNPGSSSSFENPVARHRPAVVGAPAGTNVQRLQIVRDSLQRAQHSLAMSARLLNATAVAFQERSTASTSSTAQLAQENDVLSSAKTLLAELAVDLRR